MWLIVTWYSEIEHIWYFFPWLRGEVSGTRSQQLAEKRKLESWQSSLCDFSLSFFLFFFFPLLLLAFFLLYLYLYWVSKAGSASHQRLKKYILISGGSRPSDNGGGSHPDPEIRGGGLKKFFFWPFGAQFGLKIRRAPGLSPGSATVNDLASSRSNEHIHTNKGGAKRRRNRAERRQRAVRRFTRFVDYGLMFDSTRSFSMEYDLIQLDSFNLLKIPRIVASPTSRSASVFYPLASYDKEWPYLVFPAVYQFIDCFSGNNKSTDKAIAPTIWRQKRQSRDARMLPCLIYFIAPFSINEIPHNFVVPQAMTRAIPQTHSVLYPHRFPKRRGFFRLCIRFVSWFFVQCFAFFCRAEWNPACVLLLVVYRYFFTCPDLLPLQKELYPCLQSKNHHEN